MPGTLYVVATPIGNLEDVTLRALRVLREVALIAAEDTRRTARLLQHYSISTPTTSLHEHNEHARTRGLISRLSAGESIALVSDAGTPVISDPGARLVAAAHAARRPRRTGSGPERGRRDALGVRYRRRGVRVRRLPTFSVKSQKTVASDTRQGGTARSSCSRLPIGFGEPSAISRRSLGNRPDGDWQGAYQDARNIGC